ncbi:hypothetical protein PENDEC_c019G06277 [Penicillium decumbens]|uniref:Uncharacterized protein n=1 Tax=Penicillium decumbens TaxID=69771 RepID=A0A1V6P6Z2_PENDC|nr:hypothetical protein PENDEC_c019G06277 [Penicillium decumbens]
MAVSRRFAKTPQFIAFNKSVRHGQHDIISMTLQRLVSNFRVYHVCDKSRLGQMFEQLTSPLHLGFLPDNGCYHLVLEIYRTRAFQGDLTRGMLVLAALSSANTCAGSRSELPKPRSFLRKVRAEVRERKRVDAE